MPSKPLKKRVWLSEIVTRIPWKSKMPWRLELAIADGMNVEYEQEIMDFETMAGAFCERSCVRGENKAMQALREIRSAFDLQSKGRD
jgi:hypothetical protein